MTHPVLLDIPCDVQQVDDAGRPWAFLDEARNPERIRVDAIVVTGDEEDPVLARVHALTNKPNGVLVSLELLPGDAIEYAEAVTRATFVRPDLLVVGLGHAGCLVAGDPLATVAAGLHS